MVKETLDNASDEQASINVMEMSDAEFLKLSEPPAVSVIPEKTDDNTSSNDGTDNSDDSGVDSNSDDNSSGSENPEQKEKSDDSTADSKTSSGAKTAAADDQNADKSADTKSDPPSSAIDYKGEYEKLMAPFRANGMDIQVKSTDEILTLMQMGANYHKKMSALKPTMKVVKLLEKHQLLDESKLSFLIDINNKNPEAIAKLFKDSGIDPLSIDTTVDKPYSPQVARVSDVELDLDSVLESIQDTPSYARTLKVVSETWDDASRTAIATAPHIIAIINEHIGNGTFDKVFGEVERARRFGKLQGLSDFEAYKAMGDYLHAQGQLGNPPPKTTNTDQTQAQKKEVEDKRKSQKKAATITTSKPAPAQKVPENILAMSDEEFAKLPLSAYTTIR